MQEEDQYHQKILSQYSIRKMKRLTIKEIAKASGVAPSTVSRAMNNAADVNPATQKRILQLAAEMGYRPHPVARQLHLRKTLQIGVIIPEIENDYFPRVISGLQEVLHKEGYRLLIMPSQESEVIEKQNIITMQENLVDGLIISLTSKSKDATFLNKMYEAGVPMVAFNRVHHTLTIPRVVFNDYKWACLATEHLIEQGCKNIYHLSGSKNLKLSLDRIRGFKKALEKCHYKDVDNRIIEAGFTLEEGETATQKLLGRGIIPDGISAGNDPVAMGAVRALKKADIRVPQQVKVIGFSGSSWGELVSPSLSTVEQPTREIGMEAARLLLLQLKGHKPENTPVVLNGRLVLRDSTLSGDFG